MTGPPGVERSANAAVEWVERNTKRTLTEGQARCVTVLCTIARSYNLPLIGEGWAGAVDYSFARDMQPLEDDEAPILAPVEFAPWGIIARLHQGLSTFDGSELTRLVLAAHDHAVRVDVRPRLFRWVDRESYLSKYSGLVDGKASWTETDEHPSGPSACLEVMLHPRQRDGSTWERHPTLDQVWSLTAVKDGVAP